MKCEDYDMNEFLSFKIRQDNTLFREEIYPLVLCLSGSMLCDVYLNLTVWLKMLTVCVSSRN